MYFDNELIGDIDGKYMVDKDTCNSIRDITIKTETSEMEWKHHSLWCDKYDLIDYSTSQEGLE